MNEQNMKKSLSSMYHRFLKRGIAGITSSSRVLPDFIIIGTVRSGSTSLYYNICEHPSILPASYDEIGFFDSNYHLGIDWYRSMFPRQKKMKKTKKETGYALTGEDTPFYFWKREVAERILEILPNVKIIAIFRNPIDRAYSNYNLGLRKNTEKLTFEEAIDEEIEFLEKHSFRECVDRRRSYLSKGLYEKQVKVWFELFDTSQIHILSTDQMQKNPQKELQKIFSFLEISDYAIKNPQKQKSAEYSKMRSDTRRKLLDFYKPHNDEFFRIIKQKFDWEN